MNNLLSAAALLTIFPLRRQPDFSARTLAFFPLVGALLGGVLVAAYWLLHLVLPPIVTAALTVALWALLTGGLHLDGVSDACDGLFAAATRERRLEILRDVHVGAFGVIGIVLVLFTKFAALTQTQMANVFLAPVLARWALVYAATYPLARTDGMAALIRTGLGRRELVLATFITFLCVAMFGWLGVACWLGAVIVASLLARFALARLGGMTGDVYGLICECVEVCVLIIGAAW